MFCSPGDRHSAIAPAKINLTLRVLGRREDGYHDIESVVAKVTLYDGIDLFFGDDPAIQIECSNPAIPTDSRNTIWQAITLLSAHSGPLPAMRVQLHKCIPSAAGLGGGSSDAAAILQLLNRRLSLGLSASDLNRIGSQVGSDVPMFLSPWQAYVTGRGEIVQKVQLPWAGWLVLVYPPFGISTAKVYESWQVDTHRHTGGARGCLTTDCNTAEKMAAMLFNDLEDSVFAVEPRLKTIKIKVEESAGKTFHVTGSGSTLFACFDSHEEAQWHHQRIEQLPDLECQVTRVFASDDNK